MRIEDGGARPAVIQGFAPVCAADAHTLILGSVPGEASLRAQRYYAHPQNQFWPILGQILGMPSDGPYDDRLRTLIASGIALWDVLGACVRSGSLDSDIVAGSQQVNDFAGFLAAHPRIRLVLFNGAKAEACFRRQVLPVLADCPLRLERLPSTSPANAATPYSAKLAAWRTALAAATPGNGGFRV